MASRKPPNITIRGFRQRIPAGYIVGRVDQGDGRAQLIRISDLRGMVGISPLETSGPSGLSDFNAGVGLMAEGVMEIDEFLGEVIFTRAVTFADGFPGAYAWCESLPANDVASIIIVQRRLFTDTEIGSITFFPETFGSADVIGGSPIGEVSGLTAGSNFGTFAGSGSFLPGDRMAFYAPTPQDPGLQTVVALMTGTPS